MRVMSGCTPVHLPDPGLRLVTFIKTARLSPSDWRTQNIFHFHPNEKSCSLLCGKAILCRLHLQELRLTFFCIRQLGHKVLRVERTHPIAVITTPVRPLRCVPPANVRDLSVIRSTRPFGGCQGKLANVGIEAWSAWSRFGEGGMHCSVQISHQGKLGRNPAPSTHTIGSMFWASREILQGGCRTIRCRCRTWQVVFSRDVSEIDFTGKTCLTKGVDQLIWPPPPQKKKASLWNLRQDCLFWTFFVGEFLHTPRCHEKKKVTSHAFYDWHCFRKCFVWEHHSNFALSARPFLSSNQFCFPRKWILCWYHWEICFSNATCLIEASRVKLFAMLDLPRIRLNLHVRISSEFHQYLLIKRSDCSKHFAVSNSAESAGASARMTYM